MSKSQGKNVLDGRQKLLITTFKPMTKVKKLNCITNNSGQAEFAPLCPRCRTPVATKDLIYRQYETYQCASCKTKSIFTAWTDTPYGRDTYYCLLSLIN
jgi:hypothetical protein